MILSFNVHCYIACKNDLREFVAFASFVSVYLWSMTDWFPLVVVPVVVVMFRQYFELTMFSSDWIWRFNIKWRTPSQLLMQLITVVATEKLLLLLTLSVRPADSGCVCVRACVSVCVSLCLLPAEPMQGRQRHGLVCIPPLTYAPSLSPCWADSDLRLESIKLSNRLRPCPLVDSACLLSLLQRKSVCCQHWSLLSST